MHQISIFPSSILRKPAQEVDDVHDPEVKNVISDLFEIMGQYSHCVGLAANQIGSDLNIFVANASKNKRCESKYGEVVLVNPILVEEFGENTAREGCMSVPDLTGNVRRAQRIIMTALDANGDEQIYEVSDYEARVFLHELDHLNGQIFFDRIKSTRDIFSRKRYK